MQRQLDTIKIFNYEIDNFLEFLKILAPSELRGKIHQIELFKQSNKLGPIKYYAIYVLPYKKHIADRDVNYFLSKDIITNTDSDHGHDFRVLEEILKSIWINLSEENRQVCIDHLILLNKDAIAYMKALIDTNTYLSYDVWNKFNDAHNIHITDKYSVNYYVTEKQMNLANDAISNSLLKIVKVGSK